MDQKAFTKAGKSSLTQGGSTEKLSPVSGIGMSVDVIPVFSKLAPNGLIRY